MQPFDVKLDYRGRSWCTVKFELGHNELGDADQPEYHLSNSLVGFFTEAGLEEPKPVPVMCADHQVAQKLHALSSPGSERAKGLVDLQLLDKGENLDLSRLAETCARLFDYRRQQSWPPTIQIGGQWDTPYIEAAEDAAVLPAAEEVVVWANKLVQRIAASSSLTPGSEAAK